MAINQTQRPRYYEDQYLGADDLDQAVAYGQIQQARHSLGAHTWGICIGLDLIEKPRAAGDEVDIFITPGYGWDGYGRPIVALAPIPVPASFFGDIKFNSKDPRDRDGTGRLVKVWFQYDEQRLRTPTTGFESCNDVDNNSRIEETFRIFIGEPSKAQQHGSVIINSTPIDPIDAVGRFENFPTPDAGSSSTGRKLRDESVPQQEFPTGEPPWPWLLPIGYVRWLPAQAGPGRFLPRDDKDPKKTPDSDEIRKFRRYVGIVAETIEGAGGVIRLRDRFKDPGAVNFRPPVITTDPQKPPENDLVWVEGDLRVLGDARLAGGKLVFRDSKGEDESTPLEIRRSGDQAGAQGQRTLQVVIGPEGQDTNRFAVGRLKSDKSIDQKMVVTSEGKVGIGTLQPAKTLHLVGVNTDWQAIFGDAGIWSGNDGVWRRTVFGAYTAGFDVTLNTNGKDRLVVKDNVGSIGIGTSQPEKTLHVVGANNDWQAVFGAAGIWSGDGDTTLRWKRTVFGAFSNGFDVTLNTNGKDRLVVKDNAGSIGIGTSQPEKTLHVVGANNDWQAVFGAAGIWSGDGDATLRWKRTVFGAFSNGFDVTLNTNGKDRLVVKDDTGRIGIGTALPETGVHLHVNGAVKASGVMFADAFSLNASDRALKKDISALTQALTKLLRLRGVAFRWNEPEKFSNQSGEQIGLIAQEVENVFPDWVMTAPNGYKTLAIRGFEALIIEAVRELQNQIEELRTRIDQFASSRPAPRQRKNTTKG